MTQSNPPSRPRTLQPPNWSGPSSVASLALERLTERRPISRRGGGRAEAQTLRSQLIAARERADIDAERVLSAQLARLLVARGVELEEATRLARRSLLMGDAPKLREELSVWFAGLGDSALAAGTLMPLLERERDPSARAQLLIRIAVLRSRAGDARGAAQALIHAADADRSDPLPYELLGALGAWAKDTLSASKASRAFLEAAQRRLEKNDSRGAAENLLQAFETAPGYELAAERLAHHLAQGGRYQAADEVLRTCAKASADPDVIHARRLRDALGSGGVPIALAAALDAKADRTLDAEPLLAAATLVSDGAGHVPIPHFDGMLFALGAGELLAARLELLSLRQGGEALARTLHALARLCAGPLGNPARSALHLAEALVADPRLADAFTALRQYSIASGDYAPWLLAAQRLAAGPLTPFGAHIVGEFCVHAENQVSSVRLWLLRRLREEGHGSPEFEALEAALAQGADELRSDQDPWESAALSALDVGSLSLAALRQLAAQSAGDPAALELHQRALDELRRREPESQQWTLALARALERAERFGELETLWRGAMDAAEDSSAARLALLRLHLKQGHEPRALELLRSPAAPNNAEEAALLSALASVHGDLSDRALGLALLAGTVRPNVRATLYSIAAESAHHAGEPERAVRLAELACRADPAAARPVVCYVEVAEGRKDRVAVLALERASEVTVPRADWCRRLAEAAEAQGQTDAVLRWLRRWVSLTPLDQTACAALLRALAQQDDVEPLNKGLTWLLGQPQPISRFVPELTAALRRLAALDARVAEQHAARLLGVLGVRDPDLTSAILEVADKAEQPRLRLAVLERQLPGLSRSEAAQLLLAIAEQRRVILDADGAADALRRALREDGNVCATPVLELLGQLGPTTTSDGELAVLECRAQGLLCRLGQAGAPGELAAETTEAFRQWGAALWDLAGDRNAAIQAWQTGAKLDAERGDEGLVRDLISFGGYASAVPLVLELSRTRERKSGASLLVVTSAVALIDGFQAEALSLAEQALELDPSRTEALAVLERAAGAAEIERLAVGYRKASGAVLGAYGERALNYRAARQFERRGETERALTYAVKAFESVPAEGVTFALMLRLSQVLGENQTAARAIERVAAKVGTSSDRVHWLERAARAVGPGLDGMRLRVEVLLRTLAVQVEVETLQVLKQAFEELLQADAASRAELAPRFVATGSGLLAALERPADVAAALSLATIAKDVFENASLCTTALIRALELDATAQAFAASAQFTEFLAERPGAAGSLIQAGKQRCENAVPLHPELLTLLHALSLRWAKDSVAVFSVARAEQAPADLQLFATAKREAEGDAQLLARLDNITPWSEHLKRVLASVEQSVSAEPEKAVALLIGILAEPRLEGEDYAGAFIRLGQIYASLGHVQALEELMMKAIESPRLSYEKRTEVARDLARSLSDRAAYTAALDVLLMAERWDGLDASDYENAADLAARGGDVGRELSVLTKLEMLLGDDEKPALWRRAAALHKQLGQSRQAVDYYERVLEADPADPEARQFMLDDAEQRQDWRQLADLLSRELARREPAPENYLQLAEVFGERMKNRAEAVAVLENGLRAFPEDPGLLAALGNEFRSLSKLAEAAEAYRRASRTTRDPRHASRLAELACRAYVDAGDAAAAQRLLALKGVYPNTESLASLRVELARVRRDDSELGTSLEELAQVSTSSPKARANLLREAAELALRMADLELAVARAQRACAALPGDASLRLFSAALDYRRRGAGSSEAALAAISELRSMNDVQDPELLELRAFLLAEALDSRVESGAGLSELQDAERRVGTRPLIALGLAERLSRSGRSDEALTYYDRALAGDLRGLRDPAEVALFSARYAQQVGDLDQALHFATEADKRTAGSSADIAELLLELSTQRVARRKIEPAYPGTSRRPAAVHSTASDGPSGVPVAPPIFRIEQVSSAPGDDGMFQKVGEVASPDVKSEAAFSSSGPPTEQDQTEPVPLVQSPRAQAAPPPKPKRDWSVTQPTYLGNLPKESPLDVTVSPLPPDPRTLGKTWSSQQTPPPADTSSRVVDSLSPGEHLAVSHVSPAVGEASTEAKPQVWQQADPRVQSLGRKRAGESTLKPWEHAPSAPSPDAEWQRVQTPEHLPTSPGLGAVRGRTSETTATDLRAQESKPTPMDGVAAQGQRRFRSTRRSSPPPPPNSASARPRSSFPPASNKESGLWERLVAGETDAGLALAELLQPDATRAHELVAIYRLCASQRPGDPALLQKLCEASVRDRDLVYASAVRHVCLVFSTPKDAPAAPELTLQQEDSAALLRLLSPSPVPALEALALIWQEAIHLFRPRSSQLPEYRRVSASTTSAFGQLVATAGRFLGATRTAVRHRAGSPSMTFRVRLQNPVELLIDGDCQAESPEFRYHFGAMLLATRPEYALMYGLSELELTTVLDAVLAAFGPPRRLDGDVAQIAQLAESLWESLSHRTQRRMQELCEDPEQISYALALAGTNRALRRAGLFIAGDLGVAVRQVCEEDREDPGVLEHPEGLRSLCERNEHIADLVRFATSLEYAEARWRQPRSQSGTLQQLLDV